MAKISLSLITIVLGACNNNSQSSDSDVSGQWRANIERLGLLPVYPPSEDIKVGDIELAFEPQAIGNPGFRLSSSFQPLLLDHVTDADQAVRDFYSGRSLVAPSDEGAPIAGGNISTLRVAAFPAFIIAHELGREIPTGGYHGSTGADGGLSFHRGEKVRVSLAGAFTYGLPYRKAKELFDTYCEATCNCGGSNLKSLGDQYALTNGRKISGIPTISFVYRTYLTDGLVYAASTGLRAHSDISANSSIVSEVQKGKKESPGNESTNPPNSAVGVSSVQERFPTPLVVGIQTIRYQQRTCSKESASDKSAAAVPRSPDLVGN